MIRVKCVTCEGPTCAPADGPGRVSAFELSPVLGRSRALRVAESKLLRVDCVCQGQGIVPGGHMAGKAAAGSSARQTKVGGAVPGVAHRASRAARPSVAVAVAVAVAVNASSPLLSSSLPCVGGVDLAIDIHRTEFFLPKTP